MCIAESHPLLSLVPKLTRAAYKRGSGDNRTVLPSFQMTNHSTDAVICPIKLVVGNLVTLNFSVPNIAQKKNVMNI